MAFIERVSKDEVLRFIKEFHGRYGVTPGAGFMAGIYKCTPKTIHVKLNELEASGHIRQIKKVKNIVSYELTECGEKIEA